MLTGCFVDHPLKWQLEFERELGTITGFGLPSEAQNAGVPFRSFSWSMGTAEHVLHMGTCQAIGYPMMHKKNIIWIGKPLVWGFSYFCTTDKSFTVNYWDHGGWSYSRDYPMMMQLASCNSWPWPIEGMVVGCLLCPCEATVLGGQDEQLVVTETSWVQLGFHPVFSSALCTQGTPIQPTRSSLGRKNGRGCVDRWRMLGIHSRLSKGDQWPTSLIVNNQCGPVNDRHWPILQKKHWEFALEAGYTKWIDLSRYIVIVSISLGISRNTHTWQPAQNDCFYPRSGLGLR